MRDGEVQLMQFFTCLNDPPCVRLSPRELSFQKVKQAGLSIFMKTKLSGFILTLALFAGFDDIVRATTVTFTNTPGTVSNTYTGTLSLQIGGLTNTETVLIQKYLDLNTNGVIDGSDWLVQQFSLTDGQAGMVIGGVTNFNVPGDLNPAGSNITATVNFQNGDIAQNFVGKYLYRLSSPVGHFTPLTNSLTVTNFPYAQKFTGNVVSNSTSVTVPNAIVLLLASNPNQGSPLAGVVANNAGGYTLAAPAGTYTLLVFGTNCVGNFNNAPVLTLAPGQTLTTNLTLFKATNTISGRVVAASNPSLGLPAVNFFALSTNGVCALGFTDPLGNFTLPVTAGSWGINLNDQSLTVLGYLAPQNGTNVNAGTTGLSFACGKATALVYGSVKDNLGNPFAALDVFADDNNQYQTDVNTDANGNYVLGVVGLGNADSWYVQPNGMNLITNYVFAEPSFNGNLPAGTATLQNFTALLATNHISGNVNFKGTNVAGVGVYAYATIGTNQYNVNADTDTNGNYSMNVANGSWQVGVTTEGGDDSLDNLLGSGSYIPPSEQAVSITSHNGTANFTILPGGLGQLFGYIKDTGGNPVVGVSVNAQDQSSGQGYGATTDATGYYTFGTVAYGAYDLSVDCGGLNSLGYQCEADDIFNFNSSSYEVDFQVHFLSSPLTITTASLSNGTNGSAYSQTLQASGGTPPYNWTMAAGSANPPANLSLSPSGVLSGTVAVGAGTYYFIVEVTDAATGTNDQVYGLTIVNPPLVITNTSLPNGNVGAAYGVQLGATGGLPAYTWALALGSANLPPGLTLNSGGLIAGTPTMNGLFNFKVQATDANATVTNKVVGILINPKPVLKLPLRTAGQFQMQLTGASNQNYTVQMSTNLGTGPWSSLFVTNNLTTNSFLLTDPNATNQQRFYRILIGP